MLPKHEKGAVGLAMAATFLAVSAATIAVQLARQNQRPLESQRTTEARLKRIEAALKAYWVANNCAAPEAANGSLADDAAGAGVANAATPAANRVVPWRTLGLQADDALDAWGRRITYFQAAAVSVDTNGDGGADLTNARWVLVSHGPSGLGAWLPVLGQPAVRQAPFPPVSANELSNQQGPQFVKAQANANAEMDPATHAAFFDDVVSYTLVTDLASCVAPAPPPAPSPSPSPSPAPAPAPAVVAANAPRTTLNAAALAAAGVSNNRFRTQQQIITVPAVGSAPPLTITASAGQVAFDFRTNPKQGFGVCPSSGRCNRNAAQLTAGETLSFMLPSNTAYRVGLNLNRFSNGEKVTVTFKLAGVQVGTLVTLNGSNNAVYSNITPSVPSALFNEVVVAPVGSAAIFIDAVRFCDSTTSCVP